jgi:hypothetical protein
VVLVEKEEQVKYEDQDGTRVKPGDVLLEKDTWRMLLVLKVVSHPEKFDDLQVVELQANTGSSSSYARAEQTQIIGHLEKL